MDRSGWSRWTDPRGHDGPIRVVTMLRRTHRVPRARISSFVRHVTTEVEPSDVIKIQHVLRPHRLDKANQPFELPRRGRCWCLSFIHAGFSGCRRALLTCSSGSGVPCEPAKDPAYRDLLAHPVPTCNFRFHGATYARCQAPTEIDPVAPPILTTPIGPS